MGAWEGKVLPFRAVVGWILVVVLVKRRKRRTSNKHQLTETAQISLITVGVMVMGLVEVGKIL